MVTKKTACSLMRIILVIYILLPHYVNTNGLPDDNINQEPSIIYSLEFLNSTLHENGSEGLESYPMEVNPILNNFLEYQPQKLNTTIINIDESIDRSDIDVFGNYDIASNNRSSEHKPRLGRFKNENTGIIRFSFTTVPWIELLMLQHRNWRWIFFNTFYMIIWILAAVFSIYRLIGLYWCSWYFSRSSYLILHLLIFTASTFSIVQLLHLSYGNHEGLPLFLKLLLFHTPTPCLAIACSIMIRSILSAANVYIYKRYLPSLVHFSVFSSTVLILSFIGDVSVGLSHNSVTLIVFRSLVNILCGYPLITFIYRYSLIRKFYKKLQSEFICELKQLVSSTGCNNRMDPQHSLRIILNYWSNLTVVSSSCAIVMIVCNFSLSLFSVTTHAGLWMFWLFHTLLLVSQITLIVSLTLGATYTLSLAKPNSICQMYFIIPIPNGNTNPTITQRDNFIYQRVANGLVANVDLRNNLASYSNDNLHDTITTGNQRPRINIRRSATFNCPPRPNYPYLPQPYDSPVQMGLSDHLIRHYPIQERDISNRNCFIGNENNRRINDASPYSKSIVLDEHAYSFGKFPVMGCNGRSRYGSLYSIQNVSPICRNNHNSSPCYAVNEVETLIKPIPENYTEDSPIKLDSSDITGNCVKEIILENQNLFRSHSLRQSSLRRKIRNRERTPVFENVNAPQEYHKDEKFTESFPLSPVRKDDITHVLNKDLNEQILNKIEGKANTINNKTVDDRHSYNIKHMIELESNEGRDVNETSKEFENSDFSVTSKETDSENHSTLDTNIDPNNLSNSEQISKSPNQHDDAYINEIMLNPFDNYNSHISDIVSNDYNAFTLPSKKKNTNIIATSHIDNENAEQLKEADLQHDARYKWYDTWGGRRTRRKNSGTNDKLLIGLRKLSASKSSLSNIYDKFKTKKRKDSITSTDDIDVEDQCIEEDTMSVDVILETKDEPEEVLPKIVDNIDLTSEILKSSSMLAVFLANKENSDEPKSKCDDIFTNDQDS